MSYLDKALMVNEKVCYSTKPHWIIFAPPIGWLIAAIVIALIGPETDLGRFTLGTPGYSLAYLAGIACFIFAIWTALATGIYYISSIFAITNQRVIMKVGFIRRSTLEILLQRVESIQLHQSVLGRILDYGSVIISGTGGSHDPMTDVPSPMKFRNL